MVYWCTWNCYQRALVPVEVTLELMNAELGQGYSTPWVIAYMIVNLLIC